MQRRKRTSSLYQHHMEPHCSQDIACMSNGPSIQKLQLQIKILKDKTSSLSKDNKQKQQILMKLTKQIKKWQQKAQQFHKMDDFKDKIRKSIKKQVEQQLKVEMFIMSQKFESMKKQKKIIQQQKIKVEQSNLKLQKQIDKLNINIQELNNKVQDVQKQKVQLQKLLEQSKRRENNSNNRIQQLQRILRDKSNVIDKLQVMINKSDQYIGIQKTKANNIQFQVQKISNTLKYKQQQLTNLHKTAQQKTASIQNLTMQKQTLKNQKTKLNKLVAELDGTINSYTQLSTKLRQRILISEDYATMKEIQAKKLEIDLYDSLYQRIPIAINTL